MIFCFSGYLLLRLDGGCPLWCPQQEPLPAGNSSAAFSRVLDDFLSGFFQSIFFDLVFDFLKGVSPSAVFRSKS